MKSIGMLVNSVAFRAENRTQKTGNHQLATQFFGPEGIPEIRPFGIDVKHRVVIITTKLVLIFFSHSIGPVDEIIAQI
ncbi:MAG: hypothetical protein U0903_09865 [Planctomycetales bacterium]